LKKIAVKNVLICLLINIVVASMAIFVFGTKLEVEDDSTLSYMLYGIVTRSSARVYYTNVVMGLLCKYLFVLFEGINWQTVVYYLVLIYSGTISLLCCVKTQKKLLMVFWGLNELVFFHDVYVYLTFSVVAAFVACQGYLALFLVIQESNPNFGSYVFCGLALFLSSMIRFDSFIGVSGFAFFVYVVLLIVKLKQIDRGELIEKYVYPFVVIIGLCFLAYGSDRLSYQKGAWKSYYEIERARRVVTDYRNSVFLLDMEALDKIGIKPSQAHAILDWMSNDPEILTLELVNQMGETKNYYTYPTSPYVWNDFFSQWNEIFTTTLEIYFVLALFIVFILSPWNEGTFNRAKASPFFLVVPFVAELFYFAYIGRIYGGMAPERCVYVVLMGSSMGIMALYGALKNENPLGKPLFIMIMGILVVTSLPAQIGKDFSVNGIGLVNTDELHDEYKFLGNGKKVYVCETTILQEIAREYGAWQVPEEGEFDRCVDIGDLFTTHPMQNELQASLGCENPYRALFENDNVYYLKKNSSHEQVLTYLKENYDDRIGMEYYGKKADFQMYKYNIQ